MTTKVCSKCKVEKDLGEFTKDKTKRDGLHNMCKECRRLLHAKWRAKNPEKVKARRAKYRAENPEKVKASRAKYRADLHDSYVIWQLKSPNPPPELIELKRIQLRIYREIYKKGDAQS